MLRQVAETCRVGRAGFPAKGELEAPGGRRVLRAVRLAAGVGDDAKGGPAKLVSVPQPLRGRPSASLGGRAPVCAPSGRGVVSGRADVILDEEGGRAGALAIVDYKVATDERREERYDEQLRVYTLAGSGRRAHG